MFKNIYFNYYCKFNCDKYYAFKDNDLIKIQRDKCLPRIAEILAKVPVFGAI